MAVALMVVPLRYNKDKGRRYQRRNNTKEDDGEKGEMTTTKVVRHDNQGGL